LNNDANDGSGNSRNGTINGVSFTADRNLILNFAGNFDGSGNNVTISNFPVNTSGLSLSLWFLASNFNNVVRIIEHNWDGVNGVFTVALNTSGMLVTQVRTQDGGFPDVTIGPLQSGQWYHMDMTYDGITLRLYLNGALVGSTIRNSPLGNAVSTLFIGSVTPYSFVGKIDDIRLYNRALNASEVDSLYREGGYNAPPAIPQNLMATAGNDQVTLRWYSIADTDLRAYKISYGTASGVYTLNDSTTQRLDTSKIITGLTNGTPYYFRVLAIDSSGQASDTSKESIAVPYQLLTGEYPSDTNTVLLLHFSENSGSFVQDVSGNYNNGLAIGTTVVNGRTGTARNFNGTSDRITIPSSPTTNVSPHITLEVWLKPSSFSSINTFLRKNGPNSENGYLFQFKNNGTSMDFGINTSIAIGTNTSVVAFQNLPDK
jgi:hypothetical protein